MKTTMNLIFPDGCVIPTHVWNRIDLNNGLKNN